MWKMLNIFWYDYCINVKNVKYSFDIIIDIDISIDLLYVLCFDIFVDIVLHMLHIGTMSYSSIRDI